MNLFPLPISLHQGDSGGTLAWKNIPGNCRYFHFLPVVPIKMKFKKKKEPMKTGRNAAWSGLESPPFHTNSPDGKNPAFTGVGRVWS